MTISFGYCTNVHAGADLPQTQRNLERYALAVKKRVSPTAPMGIGLWLSASTARTLLDQNQLLACDDWLQSAGLIPFTLNGFPFGDFHQKVVKHKVYEPTWWDPARAEYTRDLITIQDRLLPPGMEGSISTLPIAWGNPKPPATKLQEAARALAGIATFLEELEKSRGRLIYLCIEPEPGCVLQRSGDVVRFWNDFLLPGHHESTIRRYLRVCHDVCHAAVMFEEQADVLNRYRRAGIGVGKVQVSSAVELNLNGKSPVDRAAALKQLAGFAEDRYLHQTMVRVNASPEPVFHEDLPQLLAATEPNSAGGEWRVHFHVPIYLQAFGQLLALQSHITDCLREVTKHADTTHFEVETYAWGVLPPELQQPDLAAGIADELAWFRKAWKDDIPQLHNSN